VLVRKGEEGGRERGRGSGDGDSGRGGGGGGGEREGGQEGGREGEEHGHAGFVSVLGSEEEGYAAFGVPFGEEVVQPPISVFFLLLLLL